MLTRPHLSISSGMRRRQRGIVMMIALVVLVGMTLAGLALMRSVDTSNIIAGNLAFQQSATQAGDTGTETAITWLQANTGGAALFADSFANGYAASVTSPAAGQTWDAFWTNVLVPAGQVVTLTTDTTTGNTVAYTIQRLCNTAGDPIAVGVDCAVSQTAANTSGSSKGTSVVALQYSNLVYYRITTRITGPRNSSSFIQAIVAL